MYKQAEETINQGLSSGARIALGSISALFGVLMLLVAPGDNEATYFHLFAAFCLCVAVACFTTGRVRQFFGSLIGSAMFLAGLAYLVSELGGGLFWSDKRSEPSVLNAILFFVLIGVPGATYVYKARFGWRKLPDSTNVNS